MSKKKQHQKPTAAKDASSDSNRQKITVNINDPDKKIRKNIFYLIILISFLMYGNTIGNEYAMDDELVTLDHPLVSKGISGIPEILSSRYVQNDQQSYEYRPIVLVTFAIEHQFTQGNVHFSHFMNVLLYALTGIILFILLSRLFIPFHWILPASITFLFLIHPIHSEVVASLKNRDELLSFIFTLLSISAILNYYDKSHWKHLLYGFMYFMLAMLSKKSAAPLLATLPVILYYFKNVPLKKGLLYFLVPAVCFFIFNFLINKSLDTVNRPGMFFENPYYVDKPGIFGRLPMIFYSMGYYVKLLFIPYPLLVYYGYSHVDIVGWDNIWTILSALLFVAGGIYSLIHFNKKNIFIFGFLYFTINIGAFSNLVPMPGIIADRFAYGASLGFCIMICYGIFWLMKTDLTKNAKIQLPSSLKYISLILALLCSVYIFQRNKDWSNHLSIYLADYEKAPNSAKINALIGGYCMQTMEKDRNGKLAKRLTADEYKNYIALSKKHFVKAVEIFPDYVACLNNLGTLYYSYIGEMDTAYYYFSEVLRLEPKHVQANFNMGSYHEIEFSSLNLVGIHLNKLYTEDSTTVIKEDKKYDDFIKELKVLYRAGNLAYNDLSRNFQQFIDDSRNSGGAVSKEQYINYINEYWQKLCVKIKIDPTLSINPGQLFIDAITSSTTSDPNQFSAMLRNTVNQAFMGQINDLFIGKFEKYFNRKPDTSDLASLNQSLKKIRNQIMKKMIHNFNSALFAEQSFPPAYQKLSQIYMDNQLWDSLVSMNKRILNHDKVSRLTDVYRQIGTGYFYSKNEKEGITYFQKSIQEEEKIMRKTEISLKQQSSAGNQGAVQKLNQLLFNCRSNLFTLYMNTGAMYNTIGDSLKANEYGKKAEIYRN